MDHAESELTMDDLITALRNSPRLTDKSELRNLWDVIPEMCEVDGANLVLGDDAAAIKTREGYLLAAAEGVYPELLRSNPYLAGRTSVLTNVSDIYAMGGRPLAILDVLFSPNLEEVSDVLRGIQDNAYRYNVPLIGGHLTRKAGFSSLSVFIMGKATRLLSSFNAKVGDDLIFVCSLSGKFHAGFNFWDSSSQLNGEKALQQLELFPKLAEQAKLDAAKDVSMAGLIGSILMLLECSEKGAEIQLEKIPKPDGIPLAEWLVTFPSYGFILSVRPKFSHEVKNMFNSYGLTCEVIGRVLAGSNLYFSINGGEKRLFWDMGTQSLTGIGKGRLGKVKNVE